ncbi:MAG: S24/S26 family peptidase [Candidatus Nanopusillus sp.]
MIEKIKKIIIRIFFGDDYLSDVLFIIFIFIIYFIIQLIYPPLFSVIVSPSMEHHNFNFQKYEQYNITQQEFFQFPYPNGLYVGDIVMILPIDTQYLKPGDVILYIGTSLYKGEYIFHRIVGYNNNGNFIIMGDNNLGPIIFEDENNMDPNRIIGIGILRIPLLGYIKLLI